ncbi:MAG: hypothetical protein H6R21_2019 [Proteobacteria bacterium]|nr:hypothetical protein [Pseudomonadota bacterium]
MIAARSRRLLPVLVLELDDDVVLLALALESRHLAAAEQGLQRAADGLHLDAQHRGLFAVDVHGQLRFVELEVAVDVGERRRLPCPRHQCSDGPVELLIRIALHHKLQRRVAETLTERRRIHRKRQHTGHGREHSRRDRRGDFLGLAAALTPVRQAHERQRKIHRVGALKARRNDHEVGTDLRHFAVDLLPDARVIVGVFLGRTLRRRHHPEEKAAVLQR